MSNKNCSQSRLKKFCLFHSTNFNLTYYIYSTYLTICKKWLPETKMISSLHSRIRCSISWKRCSRLKRKQAKRDLSLRRMINWLNSHCRETSSEVKLWNWVLFARIKKLYWIDSRSSMKEHRKTKSTTRHVSWTRNWMPRPCRWKMIDLNKGSWRRSLLGMARRWNPVLTASSEWKTTQRCLKNLRLYKSTDSLLSKSEKWVIWKITTLNVASVTRHN